MNGVTGSSPVGSTVFASPRHMERKLTEIELAAALFVKDLERKLSTDPHTPMPIWEARLVPGGCKYLGFNEIPRDTLAIEGMKTNPRRH